MIFFCSILSWYVCTIIPPVFVSNMYQIPIWWNFCRIGASKVQSPKSLEVHSCTKLSYLWISFLACLFVCVCVCIVSSPFRTHHMMTSWHNKDLVSVYFVPPSQVATNATISKTIFNMKFAHARSWRWRIPWRWRLSMQDLEDEDVEDEVCLM